MEAPRSGGGSSHPQTVRMPYLHSKKQCCAFETKKGRRVGWESRCKDEGCTMPRRAGHDGEVQPVCTKKTAINFTATLYLCVGMVRSPVSTSRDESPLIARQKNLVTYPTSTLCTDRCRRGQESQQRSSGIHALSSPDISDEW